MNKVLVFAPNERSYNELVNVVSELHDRGVPYMFLFSYSLEAQIPGFDMSHWTAHTNVTNMTKKYQFNSLGAVNVPFRPDILLISRESWMPEQQVITEFKQNGILVCCVENSSWLYNNIKTKLELLSRRNMPTNMIDIFFEHSKWSLDTKHKAGWYTFKSIITGNPKYDNLKKYIGTDTKDAPEKPIIIVYGNMELNLRPQVLKELKHIETELKDKYTIYYRPHPVEFKNHRYQFNDTLDKLNDFPYITVIRTEEELVPLVAQSSYNIGTFTSVMYYALVLSKPVVYFDFDLIGANTDLNLEYFKGKEFDFWAPIIKVSTFEEFTDKIGLEYIAQSKERNNELLDLVETFCEPYDTEFNFLTTSLNQLPTNQLKLLYDKFNDFSASSRIVNKLIEL